MRQRAETETKSVSEMPMAEETQRIALVIARTLSPGVAANVAALLMGQLVMTSPEIYAIDTPICRSGYEHAGIRHSTVILKGGSGQLKALADELQADQMQYCVFSSLGQSLNNEFDIYQQRLASEPVDLVGVGLYGDDQSVRSATKKFSLLS
jgi:hypothetical protein